MIIVLSTLLASSVALNVWLALRCCWLYDHHDDCKECLYVDELKRTSDRLRQAWQHIEEARRG